jgi:hypothetical protein
MAVVKTTRSIPELIGDVVNDFTVLVRKETELARVEMSEKIGDLGIGIGLLVGGSVLLIPALVILLQAAVAGLVAAGIASAWFGSFNKTYGSLGAVIGFMTWLWLSVAVILIGAKLNAEAEHQTARDSTAGSPKPMGARGAKMADTVGSSRS